VVNLKLNKNYIFFLLKVLAFIKRGRISLDIGGREFISLEFMEKDLNLNLKNLRPLRFMRKFMRVPTEEKGVLSRLSEAKELAKMLKSKGYTVSLIWEGEPIIIIGKKARPILARVILGDSIEVKDLRKVLDLLSRLRR